MSGASRPRPAPTDVELTRSSRVYRNPVLQAYVGSLEGQVSTLRNELSDVYKMQGQNTQKLLTMTEVSSPFLPHNSHRREPATMRLATR